MPSSLDQTILSRRHALLLAATTSLGATGETLALASDSIKTAAHQEARQLLDPALGDRQNAIRQGARICRGSLHIQGCPLRPDHSRRESLASGQAAHAVDG